MWTRCGGGMTHMWIKVFPVHTSHIDVRLIASVCVASEIGDSTRHLIWRRCPPSFDKIHVRRAVRLIYRKTENWDAGRRVPTISKRCAQQSNTFIISHYFHFTLDASERVSERSCHRRQRPTQPTMPKTAKLCSIRYIDLYASLYGTGQTPHKHSIFLHEMHEWTNEWMNGVYSCGCYHCLLSLLLLQSPVH